jgi:hypothetical protein
MNQLTDEQKKIAEAQIKADYPSLKIGVRDYDGPDDPTMSLYNVGTAEARFVATFGWRPGLDLEVQARGAAMGIVDCMVQAIIPLAEPYDMIRDSKRLRHFIRKLVAEGDLLDEYTEEVAQFKAAQAREAG